MQSHGPKRVYTPQSLESWFEKLEIDWSSYFTPGQMEEGRRIYRDSEVRELELTASDAIVHRRIDKHDQYAVIEWTGDGLVVRSSSTDLDVARSLAVAGLHEIEELVADEIPAMPGENGDNGPATGNGSAMLRAPPAGDNEGLRTSICAHCSKALAHVGSTTSARSVQAAFDADADAEAAQSPRSASRFKARRPWVPQTAAAASS